MIKLCLKSVSSYLDTFHGNKASMVYKVSENWNSIAKISKAAIFVSVIEFSFKFVYKFKGIHVAGKYDKSSLWNVT